MAIYALSASSAPLREIIFVSFGAVVVANDLPLTPLQQLIFHAKTLRLNRAEMRRRGGAEKRD